MILDFSNPLFVTYAIAAAVLILKVHSMSWLTVARMLQANGGFRAPEDLRKTPFNPDPNPGQLERVESVGRVRRIHLNDLENVPLFLVAGLLFVLTSPPLWVAQVLLYGYVLTRLLHFYAYLCACTHDTRAKLWTPGSLILYGMTLRVLYVALLS